MRRPVRMGGAAAAVARGPELTAEPRSAPVHGPVESHSRHGGRLLELAMVFAGLLVLAAILLGDHIRHGGYYLDDWRGLELSHHVLGGGLGEALSRQWDFAGFRPVSGAYRVLVWESPLGVHMGWNLATGALMLVLMCLGLYAVLRAVDLPRRDAAAIAALVLACPLASSTRMWVSASTASVNLALYLVGVLLALRGLRAVTRREQVVWHAAAATAYLLSVLFAETTAPLVVATGLLYWLVRGFRAAAPRTAVDASLAAAGVLYIAANNRITPQTSRSADALLDHGRAIAGEVPDLFARAVSPFGGGAWLAFAVWGVLAGGTVAWLRRRDDRDLGRWVALGVAGIVVVVAAYAVYVPADAYYRPLQHGIGNRINAIASVGMVFTVYAALRITARAIASWLGRSPAFATAVTLAGAAILLVGYGEDTRGAGRVWNDAYQAQTNVLGFVGQRFPKLPRGATIYSVRQSQFHAPEVPLFVAWDIRGAARFWFRDPTLKAYAVPSWVAWKCRRTAMYPTFPAWGWGPEDGAPYGQVFMVDVHAGRAWEITRRADCQKVTDWVAALPKLPYVAEPSLTAAE
jgi:uncharacterized membrane protein YozB (DUF420 family)